jgi:uncharacterized protein (TIGR02996 family)
VTGATDAALRAAIEAAPHDEAARQVYADWLLEQGDRRGELLTMQLAMHRDPFWAAPRLERRERTLRYSIARQRDGSLFDRGEEGCAINLHDFDLAQLEASRWIALSWPYMKESIPAGTCEALLAQLQTHPAFCEVHRLDLSVMNHAAWPILLASKARPRRVEFPRDAGKRVDKLLDAPLLSALEHLELDMVFDDAGVARLVTAPWAQNVTSVTCSRWRITDEGFACLARLPRLARLDVRANAITAAGIAALVAAKPPLVELRLSLETLGTEGLAALERSPYAGIARVTVDGERDPSPDAVLALMRSPCWDGTLDLLRASWRNDVDLNCADEIVGALARAPAARRLVHARLGWIRTGLEAFVRSPIAQSLEHLTVMNPEPFTASEMRLATLRIDYVQPVALRAILRSPALSELHGLSIEHATAELVSTLATAPVRPRDLELRGASKTDPTCALVRAPVLEHVIDLTLALEGNHASAPVTRALVETPYLQDIQQLELDFLTSFPSAKRARLTARFGGALR